MSEFAHFDAAHPLRIPTCISSFLVSVDADGLLVGTMRADAAWASLDHVASGEGALAGLVSPSGEVPPAGRVLPAGHLRIGEDPLTAAQRIVRDQIRASVRDLRLARVLTFFERMPSRREEDVHWDLCFVYDADLDVSEKPPWFAELRRVPVPDLQREKFSRGHGEVLARLGLLLDS